MADVLDTLIVWTMVCGAFAAVMAMLSALRVGIRQVLPGPLRPSAASEATTRQIGRRAVPVAITCVALLILELVVRAIVAIA